MNQTNQLRGESQYYKLWFETKSIRQLDKMTKVQDFSFNEENNYNPKKHCKLYTMQNNGFSKNILKTLVKICL